MKSNENIIFGGGVERSKNKHFDGKMERSENKEFGGEMERSEKMNFGRAGRYATSCFEQNHCSVFNSHEIHQKTAYDNEMVLSANILQ